MLYREIMAVCSQIHTKHINTLCGQNVELLNVKLAVHIVTTGLQTAKQRCTRSSHLTLSAARCVVSSCVMLFCSYSKCPARQVGLLGNRSTAPLVLNLSST